VKLHWCTASACIAAAAAVLMEIQSTLQQPRPVLIYSCINLNPLHVLPLLLLPLLLLLLQC
jgi:hypothetical protein